MVTQLGNDDDPILAFPVGGYKFLLCWRLGLFLQSFEGSLGENVCRRGGGVSPCVQRGLG